MKHQYALALLPLLLASCDKESDPEIVEVTRQNAWQEVTTLFRTQRIIQSMGTDGSRIFLQQPGYFSILTGTYRPPSTFGIPVTDVQVRLPITAQLFAFPYEAQVSFRKTAAPLNGDAYPNKSYASAKDLNPAATSITKSLPGWAFEDPGAFSSVAINRNNYVLTHYATANDPANLTTSLDFMLTPVDLGTAEGYAPRALASRRVTLPHASTNPYYALKAVVGVEDYFLVALDGALFKISESGQARQVAEFASNATVSALYKWQGRVYCLTTFNTLVSDDNGENWQRLSPLPTTLQRHRPYPIGDSLVCAISDNLVVLRWRANGGYVRVLKNEGLERSTINGIQVLRDTVYVGTTNGLYVRPLKQFFESQPEEK